MLVPLANPGAPPARASPEAPRFFRFYILIFRNIAASDLGPPREITGTSLFDAENLNPTSTKRTKNIGGTDLIYPPDDSTEKNL